MNLLNTSIFEPRMYVCRASMHRLSTASPTLLVQDIIVSFFGWSVYLIHHLLEAIAVPWVIKFLVFSKCPPNMADKDGKQYKYRQEIQQVSRPSHYVPTAQERSILKSKDCFICPIWCNASLTFITVDAPPEEPWLPACLLRGYLGLLLIREPSIRNIEYREQMVEVSKCQAESKGREKLKDTIAKGITNHPHQGLKSTYP